MTPDTHEGDRADVEATHLQAREVGDLADRVVVGHLHVESCAGVAEILASENRALLADEEGSRVAAMGVRSMWCGWRGKRGRQKGVEKGVVRGHP